MRLAPFSAPLVSGRWWIETVAILRRPGDLCGELLFRDRLRVEARPSPAGALDGSRAEHRDHQRRRPANEERELGAAGVAQPADQECPERREAVPCVVVEPEHAAPD